MKIVQVALLLAVMACSTLTGCTQDQPSEDTTATLESSEVPTRQQNANSPEVAEEEASVDSVGVTNRTVSSHVRLQNKISEGVEMLQKKEYQSFTRAFMKPSASQDSIQVQKRTDALSVNGLGELTLEAFQNIEGKEPVVKPDGTVSFRLDKRLGSVPEILFCEIDEGWYLVN